MPRRKTTGTGVYNNVTGAEVTPEELAALEEGGSFARRMLDAGPYSQNPDPDAYVLTDEVMAEVRARGGITQSDDYSEDEEGS